MMETVAKFVLVFAVVYFLTHLGYAYFNNNLPF